MCLDNILIDELYLPVKLVFRCVGNHFATETFGGIRHYQVAHARMELELRTQNGIIFVFFLLGLGYNTF